MYEKGTRPFIQFDNVLLPDPDGPTIRTFSPSYIVKFILLALLANFVIEGLVNKITVTDTPQMFSTVGVIGWYTIAGRDNWTKITFNQETKTADVSDLAVGTTVCVKYIKTDASAEQFTVSNPWVGYTNHSFAKIPIRFMT